MLFGSAGSSCVHMLWKPLIMSKGAEGVSE